MIEKLANIKLVAFDVDGTFTEGLLYYDNDGQVTKGFSAHDGLGLEMLKRIGIRRGFITGRYDRATESRLDYLGVDFYLSAIGDKGSALLEKLNEYGIDPLESLFVGDDVNDVPAFKVAGVSVAVANAPDYIKKHSDIVTTRPGGQGAVREVVDMILEAKKIDPVELWLADKSIVGKQ